MEEKTPSNNQQKEKENHSEEGLTTLEIKGNLVFNEVEHPKAKFNQIDSTPALVFQRGQNRHLILVHHKKQLKLYAIKDKKIDFVSEHKIDLPVKGSPMRTEVTQKNLKLYFKNSRLRQEDQNLPILEQLGIDPENNSRVVFEYPFGEKQPEVIQGRVYEEDSSTYDQFKSWSIEGYLNHHKAHKDNNLCFIQTPSGFGDEIQSLNSKDTHYLAELRTRQAKAPKRIFQFKDKNFSWLKSIKFNKLVKKEKKRLPNNFANPLYFSFYVSPRKFYVGKENPGELTAPKIKPIMWADTRTITIMIFEPVWKKVVKKTFISIYELFEGLEYTKFSTPRMCHIISMNYSAELDTLVVEFKIEVNYDLHVNQETAELRDAEYRLGLNDRLRLYCLSPNRDRSLLGIKNLRCTIQNVFHKEVRRTIVENLAPEINSSVEIVPRGLLCYEESPSEVRIKIIKREKNSSRNSTLDHQFSEIQLRKGALFPDSEIRRVVDVGDSTQLFICSRKLLLLDMKSKKLLSSCDYNLGAPKENQQMVVGENLIVAKPNQKNSVHLIQRSWCYLEVFGISDSNENQGEEKREENSMPVKFLGILDLTKFDRFYSIERLLGVEKLTDSLYELRMMANWMTSDTSIVFTQHFLSLRFSLPTKSKKRQNDEKSGIFHCLEITSIQLGHENTLAIGRISSYVSQNQWITILFGYNSTEFYQCKFSEMINLEEQHLGSKRGEIRDYNLYDAYIKDNLAYIAFLPKLHPGKIEFRALEYQPESDNELMTQGKPIKTSNLFDSRAAYFSKFNLKMRIFCFEEIAETRNLKLKILNKEFQVVNQFDLGPLQRFQKFVQIARSCYCLIGKKSEAGLGEESF